MEADSNVVTLTREELYHQVWSKPMSTLAKEYHLSDVGLAKVCKKHKIPRPDRGYWAKKDFGKAPPQTPLPICTDNELKTIELRRYSTEENAAATGKAIEGPPPFEAQIMALLERAKGLPKIEVPLTLEKPHTLIERTRKHFAGKLNAPRNAKPEDLEPLNIEVPKDLLPRALRIFDCLLKIIEAFGGKFQIKKEQWGHKWQTTFSFGGPEEVEIRLRVAYKGVHTTEGSWTRYEQVPTDVLMFDSGAGSLCTTYFREPPGKKVEESLNKIVIRLIKAAGTERNQQIKNKKWRNEYAEKQKRQEDLAQQKEAELAKVREFIHMAECWHKSTTVRSYIRAVIRKSAGPEEKYAEGSALDTWVRWASAQADRIDPLVSPKPPSILDENILSLF